MITVINYNFQFHVFYDSQNIGLIGYHENDINNIENHPFWMMLSIKNTYVVTSDYYRHCDIIKYIQFEHESFSIKWLKDIFTPLIRKYLSDFSDYTQIPPKKLYGSYVFIHDTEMYVMDSFYVINRIKSFITLGDYSDLFSAQINRYDLSIDTPLNIVLAAYKALYSYIQRKPKKLYYYIIDTNGLQKKVIDL